MFEDTYGASLTLNQRHFEEQWTINIHHARQSRACVECGPVAINLQCRVGFAFDM